MADPVSFPVLTVGIDADSWNFQPAYQNYLESKMENGLRSTRPRHTWTPNIFTGLRLTRVTDQDRLDFQAFFEDTVSSGADSFLYFNPQDSQTYEMKFYGEPSYRIATKLLPERRWNITFGMIEAGQYSAYNWPGGLLNEGRLDW